MERLTMSESEKQTIFEIYRACRLCGAGGGYRMPIVQNIVDIDSSEVELTQKIQDCLNLEVRSDDRMPPLICELCVDKVNDYYDFLKLTRQTNVRTRTRLGIPLQTAPREETDPGEAILGVMEPVCTEPKKKCKPGPKCSKEIKQEVEEIEVESAPASRSRSDLPEDSKLYNILMGTHVEAEASPSERGSRETSASSWSSRTRRATPPGPIRGLRTAAPKNMQVIPDESEVSKPTKRISNKELSDLLQDQINHDDNSLLVPRSYKRLREIEPPRPLLIPKRAKITPKELTKEPVKPVKVPTKPLKELTKPLKEPIKSPKEPTKSVKDPKKLIKEPIKQPVNEPTPPPRPKPRPKSKQEPIIPEPLKILKSKAKVPATLPKEETLAKPNRSCIVCKMQLKTPQGVVSHMKSHVPTFTKLQNACNPCGKWFSTVEEAAAHHRYHRSVTFPYHCRRCFGDFRELRLYDEHIENDTCAANEAVPDVKCERCWKEFPTRPLMQAHKCQGVEGRPGGKCSKCQKNYATIRSLKKHEKTCNHRRKRDLIADPDVLRRLKPMQVRISRCDALLNTGEYCDASRVPPSYGLDKLYSYPYMSSNANSESIYSDRRAAIPGLLKRKIERDSFIHWDSEDSDNDNVMNNVDSLSTLAIKKLFSKNVLGKVPRKRRRVEDETFDTIHDFGGLSNDINDIISSLGDDSNDLLGRRMSRNINEQLRISLNHIIGVPDDTNCTNVDMETENVLSNESNANNESTETSNLGTENVANIEITDVRSESIENIVPKMENEVSIENNDIRNESSKKNSPETETEVSIDNNHVRNESTEISNLGTETEERNKNNEVRDESSDKSDPETENEVSIENNDVRNESTEKSDRDSENQVCIENNDVRNESTEKSDPESENEVGIENNNVRNESTEISDLGTETEESNKNSDVRDESSKKNDPETKNKVSIENNDVRNESTEISNVGTETEESNKNSDVRDESSEKSGPESEDQVGAENNDVRNESTEKGDPESENEVGIENNDVRDESSEKSDLETETEVCSENNVVRNESTEKSDPETDNEVSMRNNDGRNESTEKSDLETEMEVCSENNVVRDGNSEKSDPETENRVSITNNDFRNESTEKSDPESENQVIIENNYVRNGSSEKGDPEMEDGVSITNNDARNESTEKSDLGTETEVSNENNVVTDECSEKSDLESENDVSKENNNVRNGSSEKSDPETENGVSITNNDVRDESSEKSQPETENEVSIENNDVRNKSTEKSDPETETEVSIENYAVINKRTLESVLEKGNEVVIENNDVRNNRPEKSLMKIENEVSYENNDVINESTERNDLDTESNNEITINERSEDNDSATVNDSAESHKKYNNENNYLWTENVFSNNDVQNDSSERACETGFSDKMDISNGNDNLNNENLTNAVAVESADNENSNFSVECESKELHNHSTNLPLIDIDSQDGLDFNDEKASIGTVGQLSSISDMNSDIQDLDSQDSLYFNEKPSSEKVKKESSRVEINNSNINIDLERKIDENETLRRLDSEVINHFESSKFSVKEVSLQNSVDIESEKTAVEENRMKSHEIENIEDNDPKIDYNCKDENIKNNPEDLNSVVLKESPIKHSIENLIGDTDKNPDKYIKEVISSIEDIIMKNPRNKEESVDESANGEKEMTVDDIDDQNLMDALDEQIGEDKIDNDLLPQEDRRMELDDISEDDFNFGA